MNDFTKDELIDLRSGIRLLINEDHCDSSYTREMRSLEDKLQSMIDNYCEHDWRKGVHLFNDVYCTKCKLHFEVNNEI